MKKLIKFYSNNCSPCKAMAPVVEDVLKDTDIKLEEVAIDSEDGLKKASELGIRAVPTFIFTVDGLAKGIKSGVMTRDELSKFVGL
ncbi:thioredoxin [Proteus phage J3S]